MNILSRTLGALTLVAAATAACATTAEEPSNASQSNDTTLPTVVTFNKHVMPLIQQQCQACHHTGGLAPFALETYRQAKAY
jgi:cytochrome c5